MIGWDGMKLKKDKFEIIMDCVSLVFLIGTAIFLILIWDKIPQEVPGHYNAMGEVDKMSGKYSLLIVYSIGWVLFLTISVLERFPKIWNTGVEVTEENRERVYRVLKHMLVTMKTFIAVLFSYLTVQATTGKNLPVFFCRSF